MPDGLLPGWEQIYGETPRNTAYRCVDASYRIVLHDIEGRTQTLNGFRTVATDHKDGPQCWADPLPPRRWRLQSGPVNKAARALARPRGAGETNHRKAVQVEIAGFAAESHLWVREINEWLGEYVVAELVLEIRELGGDIDLSVIERTYGAFEGIVLATPSSPIRHSEAEWERCNWVTTHQRIRWNSHWDCGKLDLKTIIETARETLSEGVSPVPLPTEEITVAEADRIIKDLKAHIDAKTLGMMSFVLANQKTGLLVRREGTPAPWYGIDDTGIHGPLDNEQANDFKRVHEISQNSIEAPGWYLDELFARQGLAVSDADIAAIAEAVSRTDAEYLNGLVDATVQKAVQAVLIEVGQKNKDQIHAVIDALQQALGE